MTTCIDLYSVPVTVSGLSNDRGLLSLLILYMQLAHVVFSLENGSVPFGTLGDTLWPLK
jgi:hypothetical protein